MDQSKSHGLPHGLYWIRRGANPFHLSLPLLRKLPKCSLISRYHLWQCWIHRQLWGCQTELADPTSHKDLDQLSTCEAGAELGSTSKGLRKEARRSTAGKSER